MLELKEKKEKKTSLYVSVLTLAAVERSPHGDIQLGDNRGACVYSTHARTHTRDKKRGNGGNEAIYTEMIDRWKFFEM